MHCTWHSQPGQHDLCPSRSQGAFHLSKISGSTNLNANACVVQRKNSGTNGRPSEVFHIFCSYWLEQKFLFHLRNSVLVSLNMFIGSQSFSFHISNLIIQNGICQSDARMLGGFLRKTSCLLLAKTLKARIFVMTDQLFSLLDNVSISSSAVLQHPLI